MAWNRSTSDTVDATSSSRPSGRGKMPRLRRGLLAGAIVVLGAGLAAWLFMGGEADSRPLQKKERGRIKEVKPAAAPKAAENPAASRGGTDESSAEVKEPDKWLGVEVKSRKAVTNGYMILETIYTVDGKVHQLLDDITPSVFNSSTDQILAMVTADNSRGDAPPLPALGKDFENDFARSLQKEIVINEDDSDEVKEVKMRVKQARQDLLDRMGEGMRAQDVILEHRKMMQDNAEVRMGVVKELKEYISNGDLEGAKLYCEKINPALENMGIMRIELPRSATEPQAESQE